MSTATGTRRTTDVATSHGTLRGVLDNDLAIFRSVPFAAPPVGALRFQAPAPLEPWQGVRDAGQDGPICPQLPPRLATVMGAIEAPQHEDCLTLTIWSPAPVTGARPILIWFHGGGYASGAGSLPWYSGERLAREGNLIVVGVNYRVGALGYLSHPALTSGNMGLHDQIAAIEWIRRNAAAFGGDSKRVTLMGQSGGAHSILCLMAMARTCALVERAILLSTPFGMRTIDAQTAEENATGLLEQLSIDVTKPDALTRLQQCSVADILKAQLALMQRGARVAGDPTPVFGPVTTAELPGGSAFDAAVLHAASNVDALIGTTRDEMTPFYQMDPRIRALQFEGLPSLAEALFGASASERLQAVRRHRPGATALELFSHAQNVHYFVEGTHRFAAAVAGGGRSAWVYQFDWCSAQSPLAACHCIELPFVFGSLEAFAKAPMLGNADPTNEALSAVTRRAIARFVAEGDPNGEHLPHWPAFTSANPTVLHIDRTLRLGRASPLC